MFAFVRRLLVPPHFEDERLALNARFLYYSLLLVVPVQVIYIILSLNSPRMYVNLPFLLLVLICFYLLHRRYIQLTSYIFICAAWALATVGILLTGGTHSTNIILYIALIVLTAMLLSGRWVVGIAIISIVALGLMTYAESIGIVFASDQPPATMLLTRGATFLIIATVASYISGAIRSSLAKLYSTQQQYRTLFESATVPMVIFDRELKVQLINRTAANLLQGDVQRFIGKSVSYLLPPTNAEVLVKRMQRVILTGQGNLTEDSLWLNNQCYRFLTTLQPILDEKGNSAGVQLIAQDITAHKLAKEQEQELVLAKEKDQLAHDLLRHITHDLKTPLAVINTALYLIERINDPQVQQKKIQQIQHQAELLERFIQNIVTLSELENMAELTRSTIHLDDLLSGIVQKFVSQAEEKQIVLQQHVTADLPPVFADADQLQNVFVNLVENAVTYTPAGGRVDVCMLTEQGKIIIEVVDTGIGMDEQDLPYIFERFYRADTARTQDRVGSGLELPIVKRVLDMHNYSIDVQSKPGAGTRFRVTIPL